MEIPEVSSGELERIDGLPVEDPIEGTPLPLSMHGGVLWTPLAGRDGPLNVDELASVLDGTGDLVGNLRLVVAMRQLARTPLGIPYRGTPRHVNNDVPSDRGDELGPPRIVRRDGTSNAVAAMRAFAAEDLLLAGGVPHVRVVPLARVFRSVANVQVRVMTHRGLATLGAVLASPETLPGLVTAVAIPGREEIWSPPGLDAWKDLPRSVFGDRAASYAANELPGHIRRAVDVDARTDLDPSWRELMARHEIDGLAHGIRGAAVDGTLHDCAATLEAMRYRNTPAGERVRSRNESHEIAIAAIRDVYLPSIAPEASEAPSPEDLDAMAAFGR